MPVSMKQWKQVFAGVVVSLGSACQGIASAFSSSAIPQMREKGADVYLTEAEASLIVAVFYFAVGAGNLCAGPILSAFAKKHILVASAISTTIGYILVAASKNFTVMMIGRAIIGFFTGIVNPTAVIYINDSTEPHCRGTIAIFVMFAFTMGNVFEYVIGALTPNWRILAWTNLIVPVLFLLFMLLLPESPRYLLSKNRREDAVKVMTWLRAKNYDVKKELDEIEAHLKTISEMKIEKNILPNLHSIKMLLFALVFGVLFGACGGSVITQFAEPLAIDLHSGVSPKLVSIIMGLAQLLGLTISIYLVDIVGQKLLLQISGASMCITTLSLSLVSFLFPLREASPPTWKYFSVFLAIVFKFCFGIGYRGIPVALAAAMLPLDIRGFGTSGFLLAAAACISILSGFFLPMLNIIRIHGTFLFYGCICFLCFLFPTLFVPETRGKSLETLEVEIRKSGFFMGLNFKKTQLN